MGNYLFGYRGGGGMPETDEERKAVMAAWESWFGQLGEAVVDPGNPFAGSASVSGDGATSEGAASGLTGYSVVKAGDLAAATGLAKGCPVLTSGGSVDVYETFAVM
jgi:hypothetical protein